MLKAFKQFQHSLYDLSSLRRGFTFWGLLLTVVVCGFFVWLKYGTWLEHPNEIMLGGGQDGFKNYMASAWHVRHDSSYVHFGGMNYPFGEHVLFTDNQPIISAMMQWWSHNVNDLSNNVIGTINTIQVVSLLLGCAVLFLLFRKLHLPVWYAGLGAIILTFLAPQYARFPGHFGLSHTFVIPMLLYWLCRYEERESRRYQSLHIGFLVWFSAQLHFYYMALAALFLTLYIGIQIIREFNRSNIFRRLSHWVVMVILPFAVLNVWIHWSNYAPDRSSYPYGFTTYIGMWEGVFLPYDFMPLHQWISKNIIRIRDVEFEAKAYAGAIALFYTLWLLFSGFKMFGKNWDEAAYHRVHKHYLRGIFFAVFFLVLFACGFPYAIKGMQWMIDYMGPLRQFRSQGRFTWVYFYVINTLIFYGAWNWGRRFEGFGEKKVFSQFKYLILWVPLVVLAWEAYLLQTLKVVETGPNVALKEIAAKDPDHWLHKVDFSPYQALLPLPYYHIGSENIWKEFDSNHYHWATETAFHTGVPDMGVNMSRTSIGELVKSMQLVLPPGEIPEIMSDFPDKRPIALFVHAEKWDIVKREQRHLVEKATLVFENKDIKILRAEWSDIVAACRAYTQSVAEEMNTRTLFPLPGKPWLATVPDASVQHITFDSITTTQYHFRGNGAYKGIMKDTLMVWNAPLPKGNYTFSAWIKITEDMGATHEVHAVENALNDGHEVHHSHEGLRFYLKQIVDGWGLFEINFENYESGKMRVFFHKKGVNAPYFVDEILIKPTNVEVYHRENGQIMRNNYWYNISEK